MNIFFKTLIPVFILSICGVIYYFLSQNTPTPETKKIRASMPPISVTKADFKTLSIPVFSRGLVAPGNEIILVAEVAGTITSMSKNFASGAYVAKGDELARVESERYELELTKTDAQLLSARQALSRVRAEVEGAGVVPGLKTPKKFRKQQIEEAELRVKAAQADLKLVKMKIDKSVIKAPFDGRISNVTVGLGQSVSPGAQMAQIYSVDKAQIRLPLTDKEYSLLGISSSDNNNLNIDVKLRLNFGGKDFFWNAKVVRADSSLDLKNRLMYLIAHIKDPFLTDPDQPGRPTLNSGQYLEAEISGKTIENILVLPRRVLRYGDYIWAVDESRRIHQKPANVIYKDGKSAYITANVNPGQYLVSTPMDVAVEGMSIKIRDIGDKPQRLEKLSANKSNQLKIKRKKDSYAETKAEIKLEKREIETSAHSDDKTNPPETQLNHTEKTTENSTEKIKKKLPDISVRSVPNPSGLRELP